MKVKKSIPNILSPEDKKNLKRTGYYLQSLGYDLGTIRIYLDHRELDEDSINWNQTQYFDNLYGTEIPSFTIPVLQKILNYIIQNDLCPQPDVDDINSEAVEFTIDADSQEISFSHDYSYYETGETDSDSWSEEDYKDDDENPVTKMFEEIKQENPDLKSKKGILTLRYSGSGDSGYLEDYFEEGGSVPSSVEDWTYRQLENAHGGWEINEGSQGEFIFDLKNKTIELYHTFNNEENVSDTIFEESFA